MASFSTFDWSRLPHEMKLAVLDNLPLKDVWACSRIDANSYSVCLPILFRTVRLPSLEALLDFLKAVPSYRYSLIRDLYVCTKSSDINLYDCDFFTRPSSPDATASIAALLINCTSLDSLSLSVCGSLASEIIIPVFKELGRMKKFRLENLEQEDIRPFSERLAVSLAFSLPNLEDLSLTRITRSARHAHELHCSGVPIAQGDDNIPAHPLLGDELRLPQLFRLPNLKRLRIRDTHLGDPLWTGYESNGVHTAASCPLEVLDLGSCAYISPFANEAHTARILARVPSSITACALSTSLPLASGEASVPTPTRDSKTNSSLNQSGPSSSPSCPQLPSLPHLRTLHLTPLVPTSSIGNTLVQPALASSPVHTLSCAFYPDDAAEGCAALEEFLLERARSNRGLRKRACSKLNLCTEPESIAESDAASDVDTCPLPSASAFRSESARPRARANTAPVPSATPFGHGGPTSSATASTRLYPALRTLTIDIPSDVMSPGTKLSPRRLAAARRRAEERRGAAMRVQTLARELGLEVIVRGVESDDVGAAPAVHDVPVSAKMPFGDKAAVNGASARVRANSA